MARYDRELGESLFPKPDRITTPANPEVAERPQDALALVDLDKALGELKSGSAKDAPAVRVGQLARLGRSVYYPLPQRWNAFSMKHWLWMPHDDYYYDSTFHW